MSDVISQAAEQLARHIKQETSANNPQPAVIRAIRDRFNEYQIVEAELEAEYDENVVPLDDEGNPVSDSDYNGPDHGDYQQAMAGKVVNVRVWGQGLVSVGDSLMIQKVQRRRGHEIWVAVAHDAPARA
jgi:aconitase B